MTHYICTGGCGGQSQTEGVCEAEYCKKEGKALTECNCDDGEHNSISAFDEGEGRKGATLTDEDLGE